MEKSMRVEGSPFTGWFTSFGGNSADSVVGILSTGSRHERERNVCRKQVLKWNRQPFKTQEEAQAAGIFKQRSIELYRAALGEEYVVPTDIIVGQKQDQNGLKHKVFQLQPFIQGVTAKDVSQELREDRYISLQWEELSERLYQLYTTAHEVNKEVAQSQRFPITMTIGSSRQNAFYLEQSVTLPKTKNILIRETDTALQLFDFGEYERWCDSQQGVYTEIYTASALPQTGIIYASKEEHTHLSQAVV